MQASVVLLPALIRPEHLADRTVIVFDVLRATTTMAAALAAGVAEIRLFPDIDSVRSAAAKSPGVLTCGERQCLRPEGFDLGNSPGAFDPNLHKGRTLFMSTTNGTRALIAAKGASHLFAAALVNATAVARAAAAMGKDITFLCAGTDGRVSMEDLIGAGAVIDALQVDPENDPARIALRLFRAGRSDLRAALRDSQGGRNVLSAGLADDIDFAAQLDRFSVVPQVFADPLRVVSAGR